MVTADDEPVRVGTRDVVARLNEEALALYGEGRYPEALALFDRALMYAPREQMIRQNRDRAEIRNILSLMAPLFGQVEGAVGAFEFRCPGRKGLPEREFVDRSELLGLAESLVAALERLGDLAWAQDSDTQEIRAVAAVYLATAGASALWDSPGTRTPEQLRDLLLVAHRFSADTADRSRIAGFIAGMGFVAPPRRPELGRTLRLCLDICVYAAMATVCVLFVEGHGTTGLGKGWDIALTWAVRLAGAYLAIRVGRWAARGRRGDRV